MQVIATSSNSSNRVLAGDDGQQEPSMRHTASSVFFALALGLAAPAFAEDAKPFTDASVIDLITILAPPAAPDSPAIKAELGQVLMIQVTRTPEMEARAIADNEENVWAFANVMGNPKFKAEDLPKFAAFFDRVTETEGAVVDPAKKIWARPRPYMMSDLVKPLLEPKKSGAYPSGHATVGTLMGIILADMVPEKRAEIMARAQEFANNRVVAGMHVPSDSVIAAEIMGHDDFKAEYADAKTELRAALGL
jgi:acid phosphatase (class A)